MTTYDADVCIVGSGVSGALVAVKLATERHDVLILETGTEQDRGAVVQRMNEGRGSIYDQRKPPSRSTGEDPFIDGLAYVVGGSTWHWVGTCMRLLENDFQMRSRYGVAVDWPFGYDALAPFYERAERELGVAGNTTSAPGRRTGFPLPAFPRSLVDQAVAKVCDELGITIRATPQARNSQPYGGRAQCCSSSTCAPVCPVQAKYDATAHLAIAREKGVRILSESTASRVVVGPDGRVTMVKFRTPDRQEHQVTARIFVLACNAFQIPRLLMLSRTDALPAGVGNKSGQVGKNLMDHAITVATGLAPEPVFPGRGPRQTSHIADYGLKDFRRERAGFNIEISNKQAYPRRLARSLIRKGVYGDELASKVKRKTQHLIRVKALLDVLPSSTNRVELDPGNPDRYGDPSARHVFDVGEYTRDGANFAKTVLEGILERIGCDDVGSGGWDGRGMHISGTTVMGTDPATTVVDPNLRSHDHPNLYVAGSATFPTIGVCNPTLTVAALAIRLGDHLAARLAAEAPAPSLERGEP